MIQNLRTVGLPILSQLRPTSSTTSAALDLNIARSEAITGTIEFEGLSGVPLPKPKAQGAVTASASTDVFTKTEHGLSGSVLNYGSDVANTNFNALESRYLNSVNAGYANQAGAQSAAAAKSAADSTTTASAIGGVAVVAAAGALCWLAREIFGPENMDWLRYRAWLLSTAPAAWREAYRAHAQRWAALCRTSAETRAAFTGLLTIQLTTNCHALRTTN